VKGRGKGKEKDGWKFEIRANAGHVENFKNCDKYRVSGENTRDMKFHDFSVSVNL